MSKYLDYVVFPLKIGQSESAGNGDHQASRDVEPRIPCHRSAMSGKQFKKKLKKCHKCD